MSESATFTNSAKELFIGNISKSINSLEETQPDLKERVKAAFLNSAEGLSLVENRILSTFQSEAADLSKISHYLLDLGGKRIRPLLAILSSRFFGKYPPAQELIDAASGIELIHMATLLHDDIIDQSPKRRNKESAYSKFGFTSTLLAGDFLWVRAFGLCAHLGEFVINKTEKACVELTEGEILEGNLVADRIPSLEEYLNIISKKTASLFELAVAVGGHFAGADKENLEKMTIFGKNAGMAFQMVDDILDITANEDLLGKPSGTDLKQKTPSLVNVLWLAKDSKNAKGFFAKDPLTKEDIEIAVLQIKNSGVIESAKELACEYALFAKNSLLAIDSSSVDIKTRNELISILEFTLERCL